MRRLSIISYFPQLGVALLSGAIVATGVPRSVWAAPAAGQPVAPAASAAPAPAKAAPPATAAAPAPAPKAPPATPAAPATKPATKGAGAAASVTPGPDAATKKAAKDAYAAGEKAYAAGDYKTASVEFRKATEAVPTVHAQFWLAMADSHGDDPAAAYEALSAVLASAEASKLGDDKLAAGNARLEELKKTPATLTLTSVPTGAEVTIDGAPQQGVTPLTASVPPGAHKVAFKLAGYEAAEADVALKPGQKLEQPTVELKKNPEPVPPPPVAVPAPAPEPATPPPPKEERNKLPAYITLGVGAAAAGVGTIFGVMALGAKSDFNDNPTNDNADKADRNALIADMAFGVALTLGITGIVLLTTDDSEVAAKNTHGPRLQRARLELAPVMTPTTQGGAARLTF